MSSRAAILPFPGDPFLLNYWLKYFDKYWGNEVDKLYIYLNSPIEKPVVDFIRDLCLKRPKINFTYNPQQIDHGDVINRVLDIVTEDYVMLIEDDCFVWRDGVIKGCFELIERGEYDCVGSKRGSCSFEILNEAERIWGIPTQGFGDQGCNFWPNLFFTKKSILLDTDRNFCGKRWGRGEIIPALQGYLCETDLHGDTFVNTSLQLRAKGYKFGYIPQYHGSPDDIEHYRSNIMMFDGNAPYTHVGSLSSGISGVLTDDQGRPLSRRLLDEPKSDLIQNYCNSDGERREWERRVQWWFTFYLNAPIDELEEFKQLYFNAIQRIIKQYVLSPKNINVRQVIYKKIGAI